MKIYGKGYGWRSFIMVVVIFVAIGVKEVLEEKGIKQTWLAEKLGKSYNMVNGYVQNRQQPRLEVLYDIAKILDVEVKELLIEIKNDKTGK